MTKPESIWDTNEIGHYCDCDYCIKLRKEFLEANKDLLLYLKDMDILDNI